LWNVDFHRCEATKKTFSEKYRADESRLRFHSFPDLEVNVKNQIDKIKSTPFLPKDIPAHGLVYDVRTGKIKQVSAPVATAYKPTQEQEMEQQQQEIGNRISVSTNR
jgi:carbonic anhydrase